MFSWEDEDDEDDNDEEYGDEDDDDEKDANVSYFHVYLFSKSFLLSSKNRKGRGRA